MHRPCSTNGWKPASSRNKIIVSTIGLSHHNDHRSGKAIFYAVCLICKQFLSMVTNWVLRIKTFWGWNDKKEGHYCRETTGHKNDPLEFPHLTLKEFLGVTELKDQHWKFSFRLYPETNTQIILSSKNMTLCIIYSVMKKLVEWYWGRQWTNNTQASLCFSTDRLSCCQVT